MGESPHERCLRHEVLEEKVNSEHRRLDKHAEQIDEIRENLAQASVCLKDVAKFEQRMAQMDDRIADLERAPAKRWQQVTMYACTCTVGAVIGFLMQAVLK